MATLTQTAKNARKLAIGVLVFAILVLGFDIISRFVTRAAEDFAAPVDPWLPPDELYGNIQFPKIESLAIASDSDPEYLVDGSFPSGNDAPTSALVYQQRLRRITLSTEREAESTAAALGFSAAPQELANSNQRIQFEWENSSTTRSLDFLLSPDVEKWSMRTQYFFDDAAKLPKDVQPNSNYYSSRASSILSAIGLAEESLANGTTEATLARLGVDGFFTEPIDPNTAEYVDIQIYHELLISQPIDRSRLSNSQRQNPPSELNGKVYKLDPNKGSVSLVVSDDAIDLTRDIYSLDMIRFQYNGTNPGVYPIISPQLAWEKVRQGDGYLRLLKPRTADRFAPNQQLSIVRFTVDAELTELGYYETDELSGYLYPIYIFRGTALTKSGQSAKFVFYVDAIERL